MPFSNAVLYLVFCVMAGTGLALGFRLDDGGAMLLGVARRDWVRVHAVTALSVLSLVALHLWVNWPWLRSVLARLRWATVVVVAVGGHAGNLPARARAVGKHPRTWLESDPRRVPGRRPLLLQWLRTQPKLREVPLRKEGGPCRPRRE